MVNELYLSRSCTGPPRAPRPGSSRGCCASALAASAPSWSCTTRSSLREARADRARPRSRATSPSCWASTGAAARWCSSLLEYPGAARQRRVAARAAARAARSNEVLATTRLLFGTEAIEYRLPTATRVGAMLGIKEYPTPSVVGMYNRLLSAPFPFVLTQSFAFLTKAAGQGLLQRQFNRMANAGDFAVSQADGAEGCARCARPATSSSWAITTSRCRCWPRSPTSAQTRPMRGG